MREAQLDDFVESTHSANSVCAAHQCISMPSGDIGMFKAIFFELEDRRKFNDLPTMAHLQGITAADMTIFWQQFPSSCRTR